MKTNRLLAEVIEEQDEAPLAYLQNIQCEWLNPPNEGTGPSPLPAEGAAHPESFRLVFTFAPNPFFRQTKLVKEYHLVTAPGGRGAELSRTDGTEVEWAPGKDPTKKTVMRKQRNRKTQVTRTVAETVDASSFFNLFTGHEIPSDEKLERMEEKEVRFLERGDKRAEAFALRAEDWRLAERGRVSASLFNLRCKFCKRPWRRTTTSE